MSLATSTVSGSDFTPSIRTQREEEEVEVEAEALDDMVTAVVTFIIAAVVGLVILSEFYSSVDTSGPFNGTFDNVESTVTSVYGLLLVLPLIAVGAMAIKLLSTRMGGR